jgi:hypothetical protein
MSFYPVAPLPDTNSRQVAQTIRPPSTSLLTIDSEDRFADYLAARGDASGNFTRNASPYDFTISKNESLMNGFFTRVGISEISFPWGIPNINIKTNKMYYSYQLGSAPLVVDELIDLDNAFLKPVEIAAAIEAIVGANVPGFTMVYAANGLSNPAFTYATNNAANVIQFFPMPYNSVAYPYPAQTKQLFDLLGFTNANNALAASGGGNYTYCQAIRYVDVCCFQLTNNQALKDQTSQTIARDMLCRIYLGDGNVPANISASNSGLLNYPASPGAAGSIESTTPAFCPPGCAPFTIYRNYTIPKQIQWLPNQPIPGFLRFQVYDDAGALLSESTGLTYNGANQYGNLDWSMTLMVSEN